MQLPRLAVRLLNKIQTIAGEFDESSSFLNSVTVKRRKMVFYGVDRLSAMIQPTTTLMNIVLVFVLVRWTGRQFVSLYVRTAGRYTFGRIA